MPRKHDPKPPYPAQFRQQMIELVAAGRRPSELAKEFGCHETSILSWMRAAKATDATAPVAAHQSAPLNAAERQELIELRRKLRQAQQERDILAKACAPGLQAKASRRPQRLRADCGQSGRTICPRHVQTPPSLCQRLLRLVWACAKQTYCGQRNTVGAH